MEVGSSFSTLRSKQNGRHFEDDIFLRIFVNENIWIPIKISMKFVPKDPINNIPAALAQIMAWCRPGDKPPLIQWWLVSRRIYSSLDLNELFDYTGIIIDFVRDTDERNWCHCGEIGERKLVPWVNNSCRLSFLSEIFKTFLTRWNITRWFYDFASAI